MHWLQKLLLLLIRYPVRWLVKAKSIPADLEAELGIDKSRPILYLLRTESLTDQLALEMSAQKLGLPNPFKEVTIGDTNKPACMFLEQPQPLFRKNATQTGIARQFIELFQLHRENESLDLQIVPVFISWGRAPGKSGSGWADLIADRVSPSWLRKFFIVLFLGRDNFVCYSKAVSSRIMANQHGSDEQIAHKLLRVAGTHFHRRRQTLTGPTLLERQELYNSVLGSKAVKHAIIEQARQKNTSHEDMRIEARKYIDEIAADYREGLIRIGDRLLTRIWNKIYNGIDVKHAERVRELAQNGHEIIYVPCHRSHMDYLLLTYVIYHEGLVTPHIAAGINLNFWPVGKLFRRGGAFFLRRSFAGNKLYTAVFREYLELLFNKGYSVKYYPEGGRSRTGRLLPPKTGMLAMTLQAVLKGVNRPVSIVPVYIGYEHVMEVNSYLGELRGRSKQKESFWQIFSAVRKLKNYGYGFLNFGEPVQISHFLDSQVPEWRDSQSADPDKKPSWLTPAVNELANTVMLRINRAAAVNGMSLAATCLLSSRTHTMSEHELVQAMSDYLALFKSAPFSDDVSLPQIDASKLLHNVLRLQKLDVSEDDYGKIISLNDRKTATLTYYRNNTIHLFAIPGLIAAIIFAYRGAQKQQIMDLVERLYPLLQRELFIYMSTEQALQYSERVIAGMIEIGLLTEDGESLNVIDSESAHFNSLWLLQSSIQDTLQRYAIVMCLLDKSPTTSRASLEKESRAVAERLCQLYGVDSPEYYDKSVFATLISALREQHIILSSDEGQLARSDASQALKSQVMTLIAPEVAQQLQKL
ncbi:glycerol-3-phosphate 1-O-acyltransferase PlsB [Aestuariibacter salexigens]|uniref:glycerol-3-phosphate 1-O-acyltransferase PlsB n=1 Tax=Aestuariibacter salexigens TaxID=226010 RepID=UPI000411B6FA|nr:glycerol-3-phosphate 1-O-acyltransferase PlsB [Aestuariibacter salexigens]